MLRNDLFLNILFEDGKAIFVWASIYVSIAIPSSKMRQPITLIYLKLSNDILCKPSYVWTSKHQCSNDYQ